MSGKEVEPWIRGRHTDVRVLQRAVQHALELAREDVERWTRNLTAGDLESKPLQLPSVAFQMRHIAFSLDRLLTYAEGGALSQEQMAALQTEHDPEQDGEALRAGFDRAIVVSMERLLRFDPADFEQSRAVGRMLLPTTLAGLLIHVAEHTQRHVGQLITTAKVVVALREAEGS